MAEGEEPFATDFPIRGHDLDYDDEQEADTTRPFYPGASSTPYSGEQYEMQTMMHEQMIRTKKPLF